MAGHGCIECIELLENSPDVKHLNLLMDPLKLSLRFYQPQKGIRESLSVDAAMCDEDGIYCELNLPQCLTYVLGIGCSESSLSPLLASLHKAVNRIAQLEDLSTADDACTSFPVAAQEVTLLDATCFDPMGVTRVAVDEGLLGKVSAETVSAWKQLLLV